ncbi:hypothetical protein [Candidatus Rhabdochlamydia porcellionis]|jgi:hypothetical protein|uniref:Uncharacterized protein n=1 Tax=Candidatus Rhabdochlamydia porcellionis TaxID=225148 RepID=A0ABX8Z1Q4_9BACT|nr:hypothetical protein [Candidatus Rhabdochlamydia porcellionis]QZA59285.1 hypothetical protein RHAB15C_0001171 [Candidatus Rhabdochlamydia porcellionis]
MVPINIATNEISQTISDAFLREKYGITKEYEEKYPKDSALALSVVRSTEEALQAAGELVQSSKEVSNGMVRLREDSKILLAQQADLIELSKKNTQALQNLAKSSSELKEMTSNIANMVSICANQIFNPIRNGLRNGFYFLAGHREPVAVLPGENRLAIEYNPEDTISNTDPTNQSLVDGKKNFASLLIFCAVSGGLYFLPAWEQRIL